MRLLATGDSGACGHHRDIRGLRGEPPAGAGEFVEGFDRILVGRRLDDGRDALAQDSAGRGERLARPVDPRTGRAEHGLAGHRAGAQVAFDLEALSIQDLPFVVRDLDRGQGLVDVGELGGCCLVKPGRLGTVAGTRSRQRREPILDRLGLGAHRHVRGCRGQATGDRRSGPDDGFLLSGDEDVHGVDEDIEIRCAELQHVIGDEAARRAARDRREPFGRFRHGGRCRARCQVEARIAESLVEIVRDLLVCTGFDDHRHMRIRPASGQARDLAPDREHGQEDQQDGERDGQRISAGDRGQDAAGRSLGTGGQRQGHRSHDTRHHEDPDQHQQPDDTLRDHILRRNEQQQERAKVRDDEARQHHDPDDRTERDPEQEDLPRCGHSSEEERACPAERRGQYLARESRAEGDQRSQECHRHQPKRCAVASARCMARGTLRGRRGCVVRPVSSGSVRTLTPNPSP